MRAILMLLLSCALLAGCKHTQPSDTAAPRREGRVTPAEKRPAPPAARETSVQPKTTVITESTGKVASVNSNLRFVVIDFATSPVPQVDQRLGVYRQGQKVGEIKISGQSRNAIVAADITAGEARVGDEVRPQ